MQVSLLLSPRAGISAKGRDMGEHLKAASSFLTKIKPPLPQAGPRALPAPSWGVGGDHGRMLQYNPLLSMRSFSSTVLPARTAMCPLHSCPSPHYFPACRLACQIHCREGEGGGSSFCIDRESCLNQQPASLNLNPSSPGTGSP